MLAGRSLSVAVAVKVNISLPSLTDLFPIPSRTGAEPLTSLTVTVIVSESVVAPSLTLIVKV